MKVTFLQNVFKLEQTCRKKRAGVIWRMLNIFGIKNHFSSKEIDKNSLFAYCKYFHSCTLLSFLWELIVFWIHLKNVVYYHIFLRRKKTVTTCYFKCFDFIHGFSSGIFLLFLNNMNKKQTYKHFQALENAIFSLWKILQLTFKISTCVFYKK